MDQLRLLTKPRACSTILLMPKSIAFSANHLSQLGVDTDNDRMMSVNAGNQVEMFRNVAFIPVYKTNINFLKKCNRQHPKCLKRPMRLPYFAYHFFLMDLRFPCESF